MSDTKIRKSYSINEAKHLVALYKQSGNKVGLFCSQNKVSVSSMSRWLKLDSTNTWGILIDAKRRRHSDFPEIEKRMVAYVQHCRIHEDRQSLTVQELKSKAMQIHHELQGCGLGSSKPFTASNGWIYRLNRHYKLLTSDASIRDGVDSLSNANGDGDEDYEEGEEMEVEMDLELGEEGEVEPLAYPFVAQAAAVDAETETGEVEVEVEGLELSRASDLVAENSADLEEGRELVSDRAAAVSGASAAVQTQGQGHRAKKHSPCKPTASRTFATYAPTVEQSDVHRGVAETGAETETETETETDIASPPGEEELFAAMKILQRFGNRCPKSLRQRITDINLAILESKRNAKK